MIRRIAADIRTLEWTDLAEFFALAGFITCMAIFAGIKTGAI